MCSNLFFRFALSPLSLFVPLPPDAYLAACGALPLDDDEKAERDSEGAGSRVTDGTRRMLALAHAMHKVTRAFRMNE